MTDEQFEKIIEILTAIKDDLNDISIQTTDNNYTADHTSSILSLLEKELKTKAR